jgi:hypothetical protein
VANSTQQGDFSEALARYKPDNLAEIIGRLAGGENNLRVDVQAVKFTLRGTGFEVNGAIDFKIFHKTPDAYAQARKEA